MKQVLLLILIIVLGCKPYPRYRAGSEESLPEIEQNETGYTTNDYIRFGTILQKYLGKPYKGKSKYEQGLDCSHFTMSVFKKFNRITIPRTAAEQYKFGREIHFKYLQYGDLVFFKTMGKKISHVGIFIGDNNFIHASTSNGVIISSLSEKYWAKKYSGARRVLE
ncbi:MAG: C40 family peptidase [Candidatus Zixiibacteriota bacterium]